MTKAVIKSCQRCRRAGVAVLGEYCARCWPIASKKEKAAKLASDFKAKIEEQRGHDKGHDELTGILAGK